ncbi:serine/threonine-protein kinase/endoribonuclease IRE1-like, partial [Stylophora pistillata]
MNPWIADCDGKSPFEVLVENESFGSALTLLKAVFENDKNRDMAESARRYRDQRGNSLLHMLCIVNNERVLEICDYLLDNGCNVNAQNECRQTPLHLLCSNISEAGPSISKEAINFIQLLRKYNADETLYDVRGNTCKDLLSKFQTFRKKIKWISESIQHKDALSEAVRGENSQKVENYHYYNKPIGKGTFSCVFPAVDGRDGREVALKRLEKARLEKRGDMLQREVRCLLKLTSCSYVVNYIACTRDSNFEYIVVEPMEGSLDKYLSYNEECSQASTICSQIAGGLEFLHQSDVLHRDLKLQNILYRRKPHFIVKISDFGLSKFLQQKSGSESVMHSKAGTRRWMAPELLVENTKEHSKATDIYSCGLLYYYVGTGKKHPFYSSDELLMSNFQEIEKSIQRNKICWCSSLSSEAVYLITEMLSEDPERRPAASSLLKFPFFWSDRTKVDFLKLVGNQKEFEKPRIL